MNIETDFLASAQSRLGAPFRHHFKPNDYCYKGKITVKKCMESGMSNEGYDCSGLVIASLCDVLGFTNKDWPLSLRHQAQLKTRAEDIEPNPGDIVLFGSHLAICSSPDIYIHASGISKLVEEDQVHGGAKVEGVIPLQTLIQLTFSEHN